MVIVDVRYVMTAALWSSFLLEIIMCTSADIMEHNLTLCATCFVDYRNGEQDIIVNFGGNYINT